MTYRFSIRILISLFGLFLLGLQATAGWAETMYIKTDGVKLRQTDSTQSEVLEKLRKGTPVDVLEKTRRFYKVATPRGNEGWVFKFKLTSSSPTSSSSGGGGLFSAIGGEQKFAANEANTATSIRGLSPTSEKFAKSHGISPQIVEIVRLMQNYKVHPQELDHFQKDGKLGEYQR